MNYLDLQKILLNEGINVSDNQLALFQQYS